MPHIANLITYFKLSHRKSNYQSGSPGGSLCSTASYWKNTFWQGMTEACWDLPFSDEFQKHWNIPTAGRAQVKCSLIRTAADSSGTDENLSERWTTIRSLLNEFSCKVASSYSNQWGAAAGRVGRSPPNDTPRLSGRHQPRLTTGALSAKSCGKEQIWLRISRL